MTPRERARATLNFKDPDKVCVDFASTCCTLNLGAYKNLLAHWKIKGREINTFFRDAALLDDDIIARLGGDFQSINLAGPSQWNWHKRGVDKVVDEWGQTWILPPGVPYWEQRGSTMPEPDLKAIEAYPWPQLITDYFDQLEARAKRLHEENEYAVVLNNRGLGVFETASSLRGMQAFFLDTMAHPEFAETLMSKIYDLYGEMYDALLSRIGNYIDVVCIYDDLGSQQGPLINPAYFRKTIKPMLRNFCDGIRRHTDAAIYMHSCGSVDKFIPDLIDAGINVLNPVQFTAKGMEHSRLKKEFGKDIVFWGGGVDTQNTLPFGTPDQVTEEVKRAMDIMAPGGGFVFAPVHRIQDDVPIENMIRFFETVEKYR